MTPLELTLTGFLAAVATAVASGYLAVPVEITGSSISISFMLILALVFFAYSPVVGIAAVVLFAILVFSRNVARVSYTKSVHMNPRRSEYGDMNIHAEKHEVMPYSSTSDVPRVFSQFRETTASSWLSGMTEGFANADQVAPYNTFGAEQYAVGQYPIDTQRVFANPYVEEYKFRPSLDTGENDFTQFGPNMDQKMSALAYQ